MPMNDPKSFMKEYVNIASALCNWFESQGINGGRAIGVMSYLSGMLAAECCDDEADAMARLQMLGVGMKLVCHDAFAAKGK